MLVVLENRVYASIHQVDSETIFHSIQVDTSDGNAAHLVDKHENERDRKSAYDELVKWYEGDELTTETSEDVRSNIEKNILSTQINASEYINTFLQHVKHLEDFQESYTDSKIIIIFLYQVSNPDYKHTIETCIESRLELMTILKGYEVKKGNSPEIGI